MSQAETGVQVQSCPACGAHVDTTNAEPLSRIACQKCGEKFRVDRAFDNYVLVETLGVGGMGSVYKARDTLLDRFVALKILRKDADVGHTAELRQEARITASVNHPHVVRVFSSGIDHGQFYLVMELVDHGSLDDLIEEKKQLPEKQVLEAAIQIAKGLEAAHQVGLIHRDVKPANILFADAETAKIVDFGLAGVAEPKAGSEGAIWGTPYYVAPERLNNEQEDFRSDIYSLGATLFHALAGRPPIEAETNSASKLRELKNQPIDLRAAPHISRATARIINRMLAPDPAARFPSYADLIADLQAAAGTKNRRWIIVAAVPILGAIIAAILFLTGRIGKQTAATQSPEAIEQSKALAQSYEEARRQLIDGKYEAASSAFAALAKQADNQQPLFNWIRLHEGLVAMLQRQPDQARESFQIVKTSGRFAPTREDRGLPDFFVETARRVTGSEAIPASITKGQKLDSVYSFAVLLFGLKNLEQGDFANATGLLEQFLAAQPGPPYAWVKDYKPIAQKFLDDLQLYNAWKESSKTLTSREELSTALANLRGMESRLHTSSSLGERMKSEATQLALQLSAREKAENEIRDRERKEVLGKEEPVWATALTAYRQQIALYNFGAAQDAIARPQLTEVSLKQEQEKAKQKAQWLVEWKARLIEDINQTGFPGPVTDVVGNQYAASIVRSSDQHFALKMPYGTIELDWVKLTPKMLLAISSSFIKGKTPEAADRQWLCAVFANETGQIDDARKLSRAAADASPEYRAQLSMMSP